MKLFVVLSALVALANADWVPHTPAQLAEARVACIKELNVPANIVEQIKSFKYPDEEIVRCYIRCTSARIGIWSDEHGFDAGRVILQLAGDRDKETFGVEVNKCIDNNSQKSDSCTWAYRNFHCFIANNLVLVQSQVKASA